MQKNILFVDDEEGILRAFRRTFRKTDFVIYLANSAKEALEILQENQIDIIISDYKMPEMTGYELLTKVKELYPDIVRVFLSGFTEDHIVTKSVFNGLVKTFISKPWDDDYLKNYINSIFEIETIFEGEDLKNILRKIDSLPELPNVYYELVEAITEEKDIRFIAEMIEKDPVLSVKILKIVNSAYYRYKTTSIQNAVVYLGIGALRDLIITFSMFNEDSFSDEVSDILSVLWEFSQLCNLYTKKVYESLSKQKLNSQYSSIGLISNIGYLVLLQNFPDSFREYLVDLKNLNKREFYDIDHKFFGIEHYKMGSYLLNWWDFSTNALDIVLYHHDLGRIQQLYKEDQFEYNIVKALEISEIMAWKKMGYLQDFDDISEEDKKLFEKIDDEMGV